MTRDEIENFLNNHEEDFLDFDSVKDKKSNRADLHAFIILDSLFPSDNDIIANSEHEIIFIDVDVDEFCDKITEDVLLDLHRCGILYNTRDDAIFMYA
jgi:uncharacterized radical SAM superfamily Fe-S cluster-containing enzyme